MPADAPLDLSGTWRAHVAEGDLHQRFVGADFDDRDWAEVRVPGHWRNEAGFEHSDGPVLYRTRVVLDPAPQDRRRFLVFEGVFYDADVWFDADYLGDSDGYFTPHAFELPRTAGEAEHAVAVEVACAPQVDRARKRLVTGAFAQWDGLDPSWNPGGIWRPVRVEETGPTRIAALRVTCSEATETRARLQLDLALDAAEAGPVRLVASLTGPEPARELLTDATMDATLAAGHNGLRWTLDVDDPPRWWPWRLGDQPLCDLDLRVVAGGATSDARHVRTGLREVRMRRWRFRVNGEPIFPMGSNQGPTRPDLAEATPDELARDVALARDANLDLLRLHAHVTRPELYAAADAAGLLVWQDLPLRGGHGRIRKQATRQAREMVDLLAHHPSIVIWCGHDEPVAIDGADAAPRARDAVRRGASTFLPTWNKDVLDRSVARALRRADPSRPVDLHSGVPPRLGGLGTDAHLYFGWRRGRLDGLAPALRAVPRLARFVSEFGAPAVPTTAEFMEGERWPDLDWERLRAEHALTPEGFDEHVPPVAFPTFDAWREATQRYQAALIQLQVEDLRRIKDTPAGGFCHFSFADPRPAVTCSVLDHERVPKLGYHALAASCRDVLPMVDPRSGDVHVVSERRDALEGARVRVAVDGAGHAFEGDIAAEGVTYVGRVELGAPDEITLTLEHPSTGTIEHRYGLPLLHLVRAR